MHRTILCVAVVCALSFVAFGSVSAQPTVFFENQFLTVTHDGQPTPNVEGHTTWTITAHSKSDAQIQGFDFFGSSTNQLGFFGPLNQVDANPADPNQTGTTWQDSNFIFPALGFQVAQDTQFLFASNAVTVVPGSASESTSHLRAAAAAGSPLGTSVNIAQLVIPNNGAATVEVNGFIGFQQSSGIPQQLVNGIVPSGFVIPEPTSMALGFLALAGLCVGYRRRS